VFGDLEKGCFMVAKWTSFALAFTVLSASCGASNANAQEAFNVRFSWKLKGEYAPFYVARTKGFFGKEGLNVRLGEGAGADAALGSLLQGGEDVVVVPGIYVMSAVSQGMPVKIIALYQPKAPVGIVSHLDRPIVTPKDLEGKSLAATVGDTTMDYLKVFCSQNHVDCAKVKIVMMNVQARLPQFMNKQVDGMSTYWNIDLPQLEFSSKQKFALLDVAKYGQIVPGLAVVASNAAIEKTPERLKKFLHALSEGFDATKDDPTGAAQALLDAWQGGPPVEVVETQVKLSNETFPVGSDQPRGWTDRAVISSAANLLVESGQIKEVKPLDTYFTNSLLSK
jgi:NitT/TauT family transport system substrate-binding protein